MFYVIVGVSGTGKSTIGKLLSDRTGWDFIDADDFHPTTNIDKMNRGIPLEDSDRLPWLKKLHEQIYQTISNNKSGILACSALKAQYRQIPLQQHRPRSWHNIHSTPLCLQFPSPCKLP